MRREDFNPAHRRASLDVTLRGVKHRLLPEQDVHGTREPGHDVLRPLKDEIPAEVRETK
jgi:hypothetical protein